MLGTAPGTIGGAPLTATHPGADADDVVGHCAPKQTERKKSTGDKTRSTGTCAESRASADDMRKAGHHRYFYTWKVLLRNTEHILRYWEINRLYYTVRTVLLYGL